MGAKFLTERAVRKVVAGVLALIFAFGSSVPGYALNDHLRPRAGKNRGIQQKMEADVAKPAKKIKRIGILTGGGPASGHNQVIFSALKEAQANGIELIAIWDGWEGLLDDTLVALARPLTLQEVEIVQYKGATLLGTTRTNPYPKPKDGKELTVEEKQMPEKLIANIQKLNLDGLITLGGDDTNGVSKKLVHDPRFQQMMPDFKLIGLPKTMDNDINLPQGAQTYGFDSFVQTATQLVENAKVDADGTHRIFVAELFGRKAGFVAVGVGARVGAARTLVPEEGSVDLEALVNDMRAYYKAHNYKGKSNRTGVVIVSEGIHIAYEGNNARYLDAAFKSDPVAKAAYEKAMKNPKLDSFGHPKLEYTGMIIAAVLSSAFKSEKIEIVTEKGIKPQNGIDVSHEKIGYVARSGDASDFDVAMCDLLGKAAVGSIINGESEKLLYAHNGEVQELSLDKKIDDRTLSIDEKNGADRAIYLQANQALGMGSKDGGLYGRNPQAKFDQVVDLYRAIRRSDWYNKMMHFDQYRNINLTPAQMKAVLWKLSTFQETDDWMWIRRIVRKIPEKQVAKLKAMAAEQGLGEALDLSLKDINGFVLAGNALIFRSGAFNMFIENKEAGVNIVGIRSLTGSKALSAKDIVNHNSYSNGVFNRYKIAGVRMFADKPATIDTLETPQLLIPPDYNRYRDELIEIPYFEAKTDKGGYDTEEILAAYEKAGISIDVMFDYGPGGEEGGKLQAKRLLPFAKRDIPLVLASPVNKDGVRAMLKDLGHENKNALVESLYSFNRSLVSHEVQAVDTLTCTSNAMLSIIMALATNDAIDIQNLYGKTWHSATSSNAIFPEPSGRARQPIDWLRGVSVLDNYVPAGTGAAKNLQVVIDSLENGNLVEQEMGERIQGLTSKAVIDAVRTGTFAGSNYEIIFALNKPVTQQQVAGILRDFAKNRSDDVVQFYEGVPGESDTPLDLGKIVGMPEVSIIDGLQMKVSADGKMLVIAGYYDNQAAAPGQMLTRWGARMVDARRAQEAIALRPSAAHGVTGIASSREEVDAAYSKAAALPADAMSQLTDNDMEMLLWKMNDIYETHRIDSAQMKEFRGIIGKLSFGQIKRLQDIAAGVRSEHDRLVFAQRNMTGILEHVLAMDPFDVIANADAPAIVREADANVYEQFKKGYSDVLNKVQGAGGALVIGAHVLENAGVISAIKTLKDVNKDLKVVVWANEYKNLNVLDATRLTGIVDKFSSRGLQDTIIMARQMNIEASRIMVINSPEDVGQKSAELDSVVKSAGVRAINLKAPYYKQVDGNKINAMPLVIGKAVAMIFSDKQEVVDAYMQMAQQYGGRISDAEMKQLIDLTEQLSEVPLFKVDDEIAAMQITYEDTLNKI